MANLHHHRLTSRVLLFDRDDRFLLFLTLAPDASGVSRWLTPGGGVDPGEDHETAAYRELFEETGLTGVPLGSPVWGQDFDVQWDSADHDTGHAEFYTAVVDRFTPSEANWTDDEKVEVYAHRWFTLDELSASTDAFEPAQLVELVRAHLPRTQE